jgi:hypothetical protein
MRKFTGVRAYMNMYHSPDKEDLLSGCCLTPNEECFSHIMARTNYVRRDDNDVRSVLNQHPYLDLYSVSSLKQ